MDEYVVRKVGHEVEYRFTGTLWLRGKPPLFYGLCDVFQPKKGEHLFVTLMDGTREYKAMALVKDMRARCNFVISRGKRDVYASEEIYPYELRATKMFLPFPWDEPLLILRLEQVKELN